MKSLVLAAIQGSGANALMRQMLRGRVLVLAYHGVLPDRLLSGFRDRNAVGVEELRVHLEFALRHYTAITTDDLWKWMREEQELPARSVLVTFDDGLRNNAVHAAPLLRKLGVPALFNLPTRNIETREMLWTHEIVERVLRWRARRIPMPTGYLAPFESAELMASILNHRCKAIADGERVKYLATLRSLQGDLESVCPERHDLMNWDDVRQLLRAGFEVGSHSHTHPILSRLSLPALETELRTSKKRIEQETGKDCRWVAYPNGGRADVSHKVLQVAENAGFDLGFVLDGQLAARDGHRFGVSRLQIPGRLSAAHVRAKLSGLDVVRGHVRQAFRPLAIP